jgi:hypothetical protein
MDLSCSKGEQACSFRRVGGSVLVFALSGKGTFKNWIVRFTAVEAATPPSDPAFDAITAARRLENCGADQRRPRSGLF